MADAPSCGPAQGCRVQCGASHYSLGLATATAPDLNATDAAGHDYYLRGCAPPQHACNETHVVDPIAIQSWGDLVTECAAIGSASTALCKPLTSPNTALAAGGGVSCTYRDGDGGRSSRVDCACVAGAAPTLAASQDDGGVYVLAVRGGACCPTDPGPIPAPGPSLPPSPPTAPPPPPSPPPPDVMCGFVSTKCSFECGMHGRRQTRYSLDLIDAWSGGEWTAVDVEGASYHCLFVNGDGGRTFALELVCAQRARPPQVAQGSDPRTFVATMWSPHACATPPPPFLSMREELILGASGAGLLLLLMACCWLRRRCRAAKPAAPAVDTDADIDADADGESRADERPPSPAGVAPAVRSPAPPPPLPKPTEPTPAPAPDAGSPAPAPSAAAIATPDAAAAPTAALLPPAPEVSGLRELLAACGAARKEAAAARWCEERGLKSVAHIKAGGADLAAALVDALGLKSGATKRLLKELRANGWGFDPHLHAAEEAAARDRR